MDSFGTDYLLPFRPDVNRVCLAQFLGYSVRERCSASSPPPAPGEIGFAHTASHTVQEIGSPVDGG